MGVEVRPLGVKCNITCLYCYQNPIRDAGNKPPPYDLAAIQRAISRENRAFTLFGGEPLMVPLSDLEALWEFGLKKFGRNGVQTNGTLITQQHIALFRKYKVHVGISIDGPGDLNEIRWSNSREQTKALTAQTEAAIKLLCDAGNHPSIIITLSKCNARADRLPMLLEWVQSLNAMGIRSVRLHTLEVDLEEIRSKYTLTLEEYLSAFNGFAKLEKEMRGIRFDIFSDMQNMLIGNDSNTTCVWGACDPYTTRAVQGIEGTGQTSNCGRTNKEGIDFIKANHPGYERQLVLYETPQSAGGCKGCRFFLMCKGQCPGTAIGGDWRNRSEECPLWYALFERFESELVASGQSPISMNATLRQQLEEIMLDEWALGRNPPLADVLGRKLGAPHTPQYAASRHSDVPHGDHTDVKNTSEIATPVTGSGGLAGVAGRGARHQDAFFDGPPGSGPLQHGDSHGDRVVGHGDSHGDHGDHGDQGSEAIVIHDDVAAHHADGLSHHVPTTPLHSDHIDGAPPGNPDRTGPQAAGSPYTHGDHVDHGDAHLDHTDDVTVDRGTHRMSPEHGDHSDAHGDHGDHGDAHGDHGDHGDAHGDHSDESTASGKESQLSAAASIEHGDTRAEGVHSKPKNVKVIHADGHGDHSDSIIGYSIW